MTGEAPRTARSGGTRSVLLEVAGGLLEEGGMEAVTLRAVGERAGVSRQAPYNHFADKATLLSVLAARYLERLGEGMAEAAEGAGEDPLEGLGAMMEAYVRFALKSPSRYRLIGQEMSASPHREVHEAARALNARFVRAVAACQEAGELSGDGPVELAAILFATTHGAVELTLSGHAEEEKGLGDPTKLVRALLARLRRD
ncbi:MAG: TetR/AcrR family transcriptional regulator [Actinomycetota bacterium]|nr:TetR/AcrR family transcriptional regulator [Actinomycetota bacterium]